MNPVKTPIRLDGIVPIATAVWYSRPRSREEKETNLRVEAGFPHQINSAAGKTGKNGAAPPPKFQRQLTVSTLIRHCRMKERIGLEITGFHIQSYVK